MTCDTVRKALLDGSPHDWAALEPHLADCPRCAALRSDILAAEAGFDEALDAFAHSGSFDEALRRARTPSTTSWRLPIMSVVVLASAAAAVFALAPWSPSSAPVDASIGVEEAASAQPPGEAREGAVERPAVLPPPETLLAPTDDAVATADEAPPEPFDPSVCGEGIERDALQGRLADDALTCLNDLLAPDSTTDAVPVLTLLAIHAFAAGDMTAWERHALQLASITEDPDLHYKLALHYGKTPDTAPMCLHHADVALGMADRWPDSLRSSRVGSLLKLRTGATLQMLADAPGPEAKATAAEAARRWLHHEGLDGGQRKAARKACESVATPEWCDEPTE